MDESNKPDLEKTRKARMAGVKIFKLGPGRMGKVRMTVDGVCKLNPGSTGKVKMTVDTIHKPDSGASKARNNP